VNGAHVGGAEHADVANTLDTRSGKNGAVSNQGGMAVLHAAEALSFNQRDEPRFSDKMYTPQAQPGADEQLVMHKVFSVQPASAKVEPNTLVARDATDEPAEALTSSFSKRSDRGTLIVPVTIPFRKSRRAHHADDYESWEDDGVANTLNGFEYTDVRSTHAVVETQALTAKGNGEAWLSAKVPALACGGGMPGQGYAAVVETTSGVDIAGTLTARQGKGPGSDVPPGSLAVTDAKVRRLTPVECERLQGFPDGHTATGIFGGKEKPLSDTQRYRQMGNAVAVPVVYWIGLRLAALVSREDERTQRSASSPRPARPGRSSRGRRRVRRQPQR
jgi:site-specific DNA-cytosine methylase